MELTRMEEVSSESRIGSLILDLSSSMKDHIVKFIEEEGMEDTEEVFNVTINCYTNFICHAVGTMIDSTIDHKVQIIEEISNNMKNQLKLVMSHKCPETIQ